MASDYPFRRILGVELLAELNAIAQQNIARYHSDSQKCFAIEAHAADARRLEFPPGPILLYLFNPFPRHVWGDVLANLLGSLRAAPRPVYLIYHNPVHRDIVAAQGWLQELSRTQYFAIYEAVIREQGVRALATSSL